MYLSKVSDVGQCVLQLNTLPGQQLTTLECELSIEVVRKAQLQHTSSAKLLVSTIEWFLKEFSVEGNIQRLSAHGVVIVCLAEQLYLITHHLIAFLVNFLNVLENFVQVFKVNVGLR